MPSIPGGVADPELPEGEISAASMALADRIPLTSRLVLELGCGDGAVAAAFRRRNPACTLVGIERDPARARLASTRLHQVFCLDIEAGPLPRLPAPPDCILLSPGLLEAVRDPLGTVQDAAALLAPDGVLLICVPDRDGMAPDALQDTLALAGLQPVDVEDAGDPVSEWPEAAPGRTRWIWRAARTVPPRINVLSTMLPPVGGVSQVRVVEPQRALASLPGVAARIVSRVGEVPETDGEPGIFILHRPALLGPGGLAVVRQLIAQGWLVVCEFDDHPSQIPILHRSDVQNFRAVHAIQTSTALLAEVLGRENPEVAVFPNAISDLPRPRNFTDPGRTTLLFAALNREEDWPGQISALDAAAAESGGRLHFHVIADRGFFDALATPHKVFTPLCDYAAYLEILGGCEVSFMPLRDTLFNRCKSDLKFLEAAAHRAVSLASTVVYGGSIADGVNGMVFDGPDALYDRLTRLVANPDGARAMADRARADIAGGRMMAYQAGDREAWYRSLWARREELGRRLVARVPELG